MVEGQGEKPSDYVWGKEEVKLQIRSLWNKISVAQKRGSDATKRYLFNWEDIPECESKSMENFKLECLIEFLKQKLCLDWVSGKAWIRKKDPKTIEVFNGKSLSLKLNEEETEVSLKIDDCFTDKFAVKRLEGKRKIYSLSDFDKVLCDYKLANQKFADGKIREAENHVIDIQKGLNEIINRFGRKQWLEYFVSIWGIVPITIALIGIIAFFGLIFSSEHFFTNDWILGVVPPWAPTIALVGACVQILVGVVNDYKEDYMISEYKRGWYIVLPFVALVFGFIAFLLIQAGLINITQGQFMINQTVNQTIPPVYVNVTNQSTINQTFTQVQNTRPAGLEFPIIFCFLAGYATDNFMSILGRLFKSEAK